MAGDRDGLAERLPFRGLASLPSPQPLTALSNASPASSRTAPFKLLRSEMHALSSDGRYSHARAILGPDLHDKLPTLKVLLVGAGGIGCELCKPYSFDA